MRVLRAVLGNDAFEDDVNGFLDLEFRALDVIGKIGFEEGEVCVR